MIFSCTKKVLDKLKKYKEVESSKEELGFYNWYVDEFKINRKTYFLFMHSENLFSFFIYAGTKKELLNIEELFSEKLKEMITREVGISEEFQKKIFPENDKFRFVKTNSRSVLGSMKEIKFQIEIHLEMDGALSGRHEIVHHRINKVLMGGRIRGGYIIPRDEMLAALKNKTVK